MRRPVLIAILCAVGAFPLNMEAQGRGGFHRGGFSGRMPGVVAQRPAFVGRPGFNAPHHVRPGFVVGPSPFYQPFFWPSPVYTAPVYVPAPYVASPYVAVQQPPPSYNADQVSELSYEVERLKRELDQLREEQRQRQAPQTPPQPSVSREAPSVPVIFVFRDGHQIEASGYAIVGQTLWALTENSSTKIPLSDLDLETTQQLNAQRGVRLALPRKP